MTADTKTRLEEAVFPLADALSMPVRLNYSTLRVTGHAVSMELPLNAGAKKEYGVNFAPKVMASFVSVKEAALLVKIRKRLWALAHFHEQTKGITVMLIDAHKIDMHEGNWADGRLGNPQEAVEVIKHGVIARFRRNLSEDEWTQLDAKVDPVDFRHKDEPEQVGGEPAPKVAAS